jgi:hypothetical protein
MWLTNRMRAIDAARRSSWQLTISVGLGTRRRQQRFNVMIDSLLSDAQNDLLSNRLLF